MTFPSVKVTLLASVFALGCLLSSSAHAAIVRTSSGAPVLSGGGNCVVSNWEGSNECEAAKAEAGISPTTDRAPEAVPCAGMLHDHEHVVYFDFNKATLSAQAKHRLDHIAKKLTRIDKKQKHKNGNVDVAVFGFADRLGSVKTNEQLALKRAKTVRDYLVAKGVAVSKVEVQDGVKTDCSATLPRAKLIDCLRDDRRVEIQISHAQK